MTKRQILSPAAVFLGVFALGMLVVQSGGRGTREEVREKREEERGGRAPLLRGRDIPFDVDFPRGTRILMDDASAKGWQQIGEFPCHVDEAVELVDSIMRSRGFALHSRVDEAPHGRRQLLQEWRDDGGRSVIWALSANGRSATSFSWGESKR